MKIEREVLNILSRSTCSAQRLTLPPGQLRRDLYLRVNAVLEALGGKWSRKLQAHVFDGDAKELVEAAIVAEAVTTAQETQFFPTPAPLAEELVRLSGARPGMLALEPSAGSGRIVAALKAVGCDVTCVESDGRHADKLRAFTDELFIADFLTTYPRPHFDVVVMNPPFSRQQDIDHVLHACKWLKSGGTVVSVMGASVVWRDNEKARNFRGFVDSMGGEITPLPEQSFRESGTDVRTVVVRMTSP